MECHEQRPSYRFFYGEIFLFEKWLMYTKRLDKSLLYRDRFKYGPSVALEFNPDERSLTISEGGRVVSFIATTIEKIIKFNDLIRGFYDPRKSGDSAFFDEHFVTKPQDDEETSSEQFKKDQNSPSPSNNRKDKSFEDETKDEDDDDDDDEGLSYVDASSEYEYDSFIPESSEDEQNNILEISNSRFYVESD
jgi:hypothetical protein